MADLEWGLPYPWVDIQPEIEQKFLLHQYLTRFYEQRPMHFDCLLTFQGYRLRSAGAAFSPLFSGAEQAQRLTAYQAEMVALTAFLKSLLPDL